ncbi:DNA polymerase III subunit epsilon [Azospirillaceae bacterium]
MREIVLDTETTGFKPEEGHRVVEIGCVELHNHLPTGLRRQWYINPERDMPADAFRVHGLSEEFLSQFPVFGNIVGEFLEFIGQSPLIIHNAVFDMKFLNAELGRVKLPTLPMSRATDTVQIARRKFPGAQASLDALCKRFGIDNSNRTLHGALLDAQLLAECYIELLGGRQAGFDLVTATKTQSVKRERQFRSPRPHAPSPEELTAHEALLKQLKSPIWLNA